jgi:CheY-like chemotaxis protein
MSETQTLTAIHVPTVYFIDDSATMREVIKIAFRKENIHVITCPDAASALAQFGEVAPDAVITDVIMPDKDGYEVCRFIKQHEQLGKTPVILMSGIVNQSVAEKATTVKADELIRKPFQPQDLVTRVKNLMNPKATASAPEVEDHASLPPLPVSRGVSDVLGDFFAPSVPVALPMAAPVAIPTVAPVIAPAPPRATREPAPSSRSQLPAEHLATPTAPVAAPVAASVSPILAPASTQAPRISAQQAEPSIRVAAPQAEPQKLRNEIRRLELLVKKLQAELSAGREYCAALEAHCKSMFEGE